MAGVWAGRMIQGRQHYMKPADSLAFPAVSEREERARGAKLGIENKLNSKMVIIKALSFYSRNITLNYMSTN